MSVIAARTTCCSILMILHMCYAMAAIAWAIWAFMAASWLSLAAASAAGEGPRCPLALIGDDAQGDPGIMASGEEYPRG